MPFGGTPWLSDRISVCPGPDLGDSQRNWAWDLHSVQLWPCSLLTCVSVCVPGYLWIVLGAHVHTHVFLLPHFAACPIWMNLAFSFVSRPDRSGRAFCFLLLFFCPLFVLAFALQGPLPLLNPLANLCKQTFAGHCCRCQGQSCPYFDIPCSG